MKKWWIACAALVCVLSAQGQAVRQTYLYAVKGADSLYLDRYEAVPAVSGARPCMIFVFGGGFVDGTRDDARYVPFFEYMAAKGITVVSIDYRLGLREVIASGDFSAGHVVGAFMRTVAMATEDLYDATAYVLANAERWRVDPACIVACGSSAGAVTVLHGELGLCNRIEAAARLPESFDYAGVISFAGAVFYPGEELRWNRRPAPIQLFHGDADANVPYGAVREQGMGFFGSEYIAAQLTALGAPHYFHSATDADHRMAVDPMEENRYEIDAFLQKLVFGREPLIVDTRVSRIGAPVLPKDFTIADYIQSNFR